MGRVTSSRRVEILAPAGSYESFQAAICAGADAVYAGGARFGARAYALNFTEEELLKAIDYAHLHGRRFYLTVNTLLKDKELEELWRYLKPLYVRGLDAVIVQDVGALRLIREAFPKMDIHASTQMSITNTEGALFLKEQGVARVVPARELSLCEVKVMGVSTGMEIECFVHGALCYSYSGQCLLSSLNGGRSGNRGQCAQPCRLPYTVDGQTEHLFSLKDMCTLELIPDLIEAGVHSFKIEGRMKNPQYTALATAMYRKYADLYLNCGRAAFQVEASDKEKLLDVYNRGGFCEGYYKQHGGRDMLSLGEPSHAGVPALRIQAQKGRKFTGEALTQIHRGDILKLEGVEGKMNNYTFGKDIPKGGKTELLLPKGVFCSKGSVLSRIRNEELLSSVHELYGNKPFQESISGSFWTGVGEPAFLRAECRGFQVTVQSEEITEEAKSQPLSEDRIKSKLMKTGNTDFSFEILTVETKGRVFFPMQRLGALKRSALDLLRRAVCESYERPALGSEPHIPLTGESPAALQASIMKASPCVKEPYLSVLVETEEQAEVAFHCQKVQRIYIESAAKWNLVGDNEWCRQYLGGDRQKKEIFLALPHIYREEAASYFEKYLHRIMEFDGVLIRNYESFYYLQQHGFDKKIILDHNLYVCNLSARHFWEKLGVCSFTAPTELDRGELEGLLTPSSEFIVYGRLPVMVSSQCLMKTTKGCKETWDITMVRDRRHKEFPVKSCCRFCYNLVYHDRPLCLFTEQEHILALRTGGVRIQFTDEGKDQVREILKLYKDVCEGQGLTGIDDKLFTRGHFRQGIT